LRTTILIALGGGIVTEGLRSLLERRARLRVVGVALQSDEAVAQLAAKQPALALVEVALGTSAGIDMLKRMRAASSETRFIVILGGPSFGLLPQALRVGNCMLLERRSSFRDLLDAIEAARLRRNYIAPTLGECVVDLLSNSDAREEGDGHVLSVRQREVLRMIADGLSTGEMADRLGVSTKTVQTHRAKLMERVNVHNVSSLVRYAIREGFVDA
jgi:DNA-binding NarL/FixJ family response regulator